VKKRYGAGYIPAGFDRRRLPIGWSDIEPYYDIVEHEVGVSGKAGNIKGSSIKRAHLEGPRSREYPMPHLRTCDYLDLMKRAARGLGWNPFHSPAAINSVPYNGHGAVDTTAIAIAAAATSGQELDLLLDHSESASDEEPDHLRQSPGHAHCVGFERPGHRSLLHFEGMEYFQPAKAVLVGSYTCETDRSVPDVEIHGDALRLRRPARPSVRSMLRLGPVIAEAVGYALDFESKSRRTFSYV